MTTASNSAILDPVTNPVLTVAPQNKEDTTMSGATNKITALYCRLSQEDARLNGIPFVPQKFRNFPAILEHRKIQANPL